MSLVQNVQAISFYSIVIQSSFTQEITRVGSSPAARALWPETCILPTCKPAFYQSANLRFTNLQTCVLHLPLLILTRLSPLKSLLINSILVLKLLSDFIKFSINSDVQENFFALTFAAAPFCYAVRWPKRMRIRRVNLVFTQQLLLHGKVNKV